jgi:hypothetical protein
LVASRTRCPQARSSLRQYGAGAAPSGLTRSAMNVPAASFVAQTVTVSETAAALSDALDGALMGRVAARALEDPLRFQLRYQG